MATIHLKKWKDKMSHFTQDFLDFFKELSQNNYKEWFHENKKRYENSVKNPFHEFVQEMIDRIRIEDPELEITPKEAIFRINRDIRFAKDKSPYKTHMAASISVGGRKRHDVPGLYFQLSPEKSFVAGGSYVLEKETLYRVRSAIAKAPDAFSKVIEEEEFKKKFGTIQGAAHGRRSLRPLAGIAPEPRRLSGRPRHLDPGGG